MNTVNRTIEYHQGAPGQVVSHIMNEFDAHRLPLDLIDQQTELLAWHGQPNRDREVEVYTFLERTLHEWWRLQELSFDNVLSGAYITGLTLSGAPVRPSWPLATPPIFLFTGRSTE